MSFIVLTFLSCGRAGTEEAQCIPAFGKTNQEEPVTGGMTDKDLALFLNRMGFVIKDQRKGVPKNCRGFFKADAMFLKIAGRFVVIPFKLYIDSTTLCISHLLKVP